MDSPSQKVSEVDKFAMSFIFDIDNSPSVLSTTNGFAINCDASLGSNNSERKHVLNLSCIAPWPAGMTYSNSLIQTRLRLIIVF